MYILWAQPAQHRLKLFLFPYYKVYQLSSTLHDGSVYSLTLMILFIQNLIPCNYLNYQCYLGLVIPTFGIENCFIHIVSLENLSAVNRQKLIKISRCQALALLADIKIVINQKILFIDAGYLKKINFENSNFASSIEFQSASILQK